MSNFVDELFMTWNITRWLFVRKILVNRCNDVDYVSLNMERAAEEEEDEEDREHHLNGLGDVEDIGVGRPSLQEAQRKRKRKKRRKKKLDGEGRARRGMGGGGLDADDLPKRARWTIIATACLLLLMSVLLVGVTLRMAPIIDEMGESDLSYFVVIVFV
ncbi:hypothetical protein L798_10257 [Zootermopsis nevadensis]|uniref:Uncharacterized protein n=1 Tax=Zootermopsis nevadensis TaxID=136037 RepID=A0A067RLJ1_ZOONE|nr:hypothetical protein L798_10257 [Zootermopsis nevadensis]